MKKPTGRPVTPGDKRDKLVSFYLTQDDANKLRSYAERGGFKGTSTMLTALIEPLIRGGLSIQSGCRSINRVQKFMENNGVKSTVNVREVIVDLFAPPPPIPNDVEDISQLKTDLRALLAELENQTTNPPNKKK